MAIACSTLLTSFRPANFPWIVSTHDGYTFYYTSADTDNVSGYTEMIDSSMETVSRFFSGSFHNGFAVYVHPNRHSLDSTWQKDWNMPEFTSECWMVASGTAAKLDMISPAVWDSEACEHVYYEKEKTRRLITHEIVHVFHGQLNVSPDFSNTDGIDWFIEGLATYASGQCDKERLTEVHTAIAENKGPENLDAFWTGKLKYGFSGSIVMYIDSAFGREKLLELMPLNTKTALLETLHISEEELLSGWKKFYTKMN